MTQLLYESLIQTTKHSRKMAETKITMILLNLLGISLTGLSILAQLEWWKTTIAFVVGITILIMNQRHKNRRLKSEQEQRDIKTEMMRQDLRNKRFGDYVGSAAGDEEEE